MRGRTKDERTEDAKSANCHRWLSEGEGELDSGLGLEWYSNKAVWNWSEKSDGRSHVSTRIGNHRVKLYRWQFRVHIQKQYILQDIVVSSIRIKNPFNLVLQFLADIHYPWCTYIPLLYTTTALYAGSPSGWIWITWIALSKWVWPVRQSDSSHQRQTLATFSPLLSPSKAFIQVHGLLIRLYRRVPEDSYIPCCMA